MFVPNLLCGEAFSEEKSQLTKFLWGERRLISLLAVLSICGVSAPAATAATPPPDFFGVSAPELYSMSLDGRFALRDAALTNIQAAGIDTVRTEIGWRDVEQTAPVNGVHTYDWAAMYRHIAALAEHGQSLAPMIMTPPAWAQPAASAGACERRGGIDAAHVDDYAAFVADVAKAFGRNGTYWQWAATNRPAMAQRPITSYEIWNEPNWDSFWCPDIDPETYAAMLAKAADAIHAVDSRATVSLGGLVVLEQDQYNGSHLSGMATKTFLSRMTAAVPNLASKIDAVAVHTYWATPADDLRALSLVEGWLDDVGLGSEALVVSEYGWRSGGPAGALSEPQRAQMTRDYSDDLARTNCNVVGIYPHNWISPRLDAANPEDWYGLADPLTGAPLASGVAYADVIGSYKYGSASQQPTLDVCQADVPPPGAASLDRTPPVLSSSAAAHFEYSASGAASWQCRVDQGAFGACGKAGQDVFGLADGTHGFAVRAVNSVGVPGAQASFEWVVDTRPPDTTVTGPASTIDATAVFSISGDEPAVGFRCRFDSQAWRDCPASVDDGGIPDGAHTIEAVSIDRAGNVDPTPAALTFSLRTTPAPPVLTGGPAAGATSGPATRFDFTVPAGTSAECRVDAAAFAACSGAGFHSVSSLGGGGHTFEVRSVGPGGVRSAAVSRGWTVDATRPVVSLTRRSKVGAKPVIFTVSATDASGVTRMEYRVDGGAWTPTTGTVSIAQPGSAKHVLEARAFDRYGNIGTASLVGWHLRPHPAHK
jgi:hypothetical protein